MASRYNLTPERKEKLKKEVLAEIGKDARPKSTLVPKQSSTLAGPKPQPASLKIEVKAPVVVNEVEKIEPIKKETKKRTVKKSSSTVKIVAPKVVKKPTKKKAKTIKKVTAKPTVKIKKVVTPAPSPIIKKTVTRQTPEEKAKERDLFFKSDSFVKQAVYSKKIPKLRVKSDNKKMFLWGVVSFLILGLILTLSINIFGIYKYNWSGPVSEKVIKVLSLPAGSVDGRMISLADYYNDLSIVKKVLALNPNNSTFDSDKTKEQLFNRLVSINIIEHELKKYGKVVTQDIIDAEMQKTIDQIGSEEQASKDIEAVYGMSLDIFKNNVLKPIIAVDMLNKILTNDESLAINQEARKNAEDALRIANEPTADFNTLVLQYSNDPATLEQNGDLGWFSRGELPKEIEDTLFSLESGEVYNQVVVDDYGYHIYKIESKLVDEESGKESIKINQIFITVNTELYIKSLFDSAVIKQYI